MNTINVADGLHVVHPPQQVVGGDVQSVGEPPQVVEGGLPGSGLEVRDRRGLKVRPLCQTFLT